MSKLVTVDMKQRISGIKLKAHLSYTSIDLGDFPTLAEGGEAKQSGSQHGLRPESSGAAQMETAFGTRRSA